MSSPPASGEQAAARGYQWQYDHIALLVYNALYNNSFESLRLADPEAGRIDDLVLVRGGRIDFYQFKSSTRTDGFTFGNLVKQKNSDRAEGTTLIKDLGDCWNANKDQYRDLHVNLITQKPASRHDGQGIPKNADSPSPCHFHAFHSDVLVPLRSGQAGMSEVRPEWRPALDLLIEASGVELSDAGQFLRSLHIDVGTSPAISGLPADKADDIQALSDALWGAVANGAAPVVMNRDRVLQEVGWERRLDIRSPHAFPVDPDIYAPLDDAIAQIDELLHCFDSGYAAVVGPPGSGKSTLLNQALKDRDDRVIRYFAYSPRAPAPQTRLSAEGFLHDMVIMLRDSGLELDERKLPGMDVFALRRQFGELLASAGEQFTSGASRTIIVVDGLDHVERHFAGHEGLLAELPQPEELPDGVMFIIGSRETRQLNSEARQQIAERGSVVDLADHPLSSSSVIEICQRAPATRELSRPVHLRVTELCAGHPLALRYVLNRIEAAGCETDGDAIAELEDAPAYEGDIAGVYRAVWDSLASDSGIVKMLSVCSRLRVGFTTEWLCTWAADQTVLDFREKLSHLFVCHHDRWRFFHDSFRQFAEERSAPGDRTFPTQQADHRAHSQVAEICAQSGDPIITAEELYHRYRANQPDLAMQIAGQEAFREQFRWFRPPDLIRQDIQIALGLAAEQADVLTMVSLLLALFETAERVAALEDVDVPGLLFDSGLVGDAISYCSDGTRDVPLAYVYSLSAKLGRSGNPAGRRLFDTFAHHGLDDPDPDRKLSSANDAASEWTEAAYQFRTLPNVLRRIEAVVAAGPSRGNRREDDRIFQWRRYEQMMRALVESGEQAGDSTGLAAIAEALEDKAERIENNPPEVDDHLDEREADQVRDHSIATVTELRILAVGALAELSDEVAQPYVERLLAAIPGSPVTQWAALDAAWIFYQSGAAERAAELLARTQYGEPLTESDLRYSTGSGEITSRFVYWHLRHLLALDDGCGLGVTGPSDYSEHASLSSAAAGLEGAVDLAVRSLAQMAAQASAGRAVSPYEATAAMAPALNLVRVALVGEFGLQFLRVRLLEIVVDAVNEGGADLAQLASDSLEHLFDEQPERWPPRTQVDLADRLRAAGASAPWRETALSRWEEALANESVRERLSGTAEVASHYATAGDLENAQRIAKGLPAKALGVGYRKDNQFHIWVDWLRRALAEPSGRDIAGDAPWLARILTASDEMTEGAPGRAAAQLPAAVAQADPLAAVRIFEYLVRQGVVNHMDALASLVATLVENSENSGMVTVELAADMTAELIAPAANHAYPKLASSIIEAASLASTPAEAEELAESVADRICIRALPTTRGDWKRALGVASPTDGSSENGGQDDDDFRALVLSSGERLSPDEVAAKVSTASDIIGFYRDESPRSYFSWSNMIAQQSLSQEDIALLEGAFDDGSDKSPKALAALAEAAERNSDITTARRLAEMAMKTSRGTGWTHQLDGGTRRSAAAITIRLGGQPALKEACQDLVRQTAENRWLIGAIIQELDDIAETLDPGLSAAAAWPAIREHLHGLAEPLVFPDADVLEDHGCRWWLPDPTPDKRAPSNDSSPAGALAEVAVGHLSHPTWLVRDAAVSIISRAIRAGNQETAEALVRFTQPDASDDVLERVGLCLAAARIWSSDVLAETLQPIERILSEHPSQVIRDLATSQEPRPHRSLDSKYRLIRPIPMTLPDSPDDLFIRWHQPLVEILAQGSNLDPGTLMAIAYQHATVALDAIPDTETVRQALSASQMEHANPNEMSVAFRAGLGRVLADLADAGNFDGAPRWVQDQLCVTDIDLLVRSPASRPNVMRSPPPADHDSMVDQWLAGCRNRLDEYVECSSDGKNLLIGARTRLAILNRDFLEEELLCGTAVGTIRPERGTLFKREVPMTLNDLVSSASAAQPGLGEPLVLENHRLWFIQLGADWLSFRPDIAAALSWVPDPENPGNWHTTAGDLAVESTWWMDGPLGRSRPFSYDTAAEGHAVILTPSGLADIQAAFGETIRTFTLKRSSRNDETQVRTAETHLINSSTD